jgi:hypothetical protein
VNKITSAPFWYPDLEVSSIRPVRLVIAPTHVGAQPSPAHAREQWIPAFAGMTMAGRAYGVSNVAVEVGTARWLVAGAVNPFGKTVCGAMRRIRLAKMDCAALQSPKQRQPAHGRSRQ